jgi:hypothetical protein
MSFRKNRSNIKNSRLEIRDDLLKPELCISNAYPLNLKTSRIQVKAKCQKEKIGFDIKQRSGPSILGMKSGRAFSLFKAYQ